MAKLFVLLRQPASRFGQFGQIQPKLADFAVLASQLYQENKCYVHFCFFPFQYSKENRNVKKSNTSSSRGIRFDKTKCGLHYLWNHIHLSSFQGWPWVLNSFGKNTGIPIDQKKIFLYQFFCTQLVTVNSILEGPLRPGRGVLYSTCKLRYF